MMRGLFPVVFALSGALFFFSCTDAVAKDRPKNPAVLQGIWSSPDCAQADSLWIVSKYFFIRSDPAGVTVDSAQHWQEEQDDGEMLYAFHPARGAAVILNRTNDGLVKMIDVAGQDQKSLKKTWEAVQDRPFSEYSHCAKLFGGNPALGQAEVNTVFLLDQALEKCGGVKPDALPAARTCQTALFALFDEDRDEALDRGELARLYRQMSFLKTTLTSCAPGGDRQAGDAAAAQFAEQAFRANGQRKLRLADLPALRRAGKNDPGSVWRVFIEDAGALHHLAGFIPAPQSPAPSCQTNRNGAFPSKDPASDILKIQWNAPRALPND